jgi:hypothetical protein
MKLHDVPLQTAEPQPLKGAVGADAVVHGDGAVVGSEVVGDVDGDIVGFAVVGEDVGDVVGSEVVGLVDGGGVGGGVAGGEKNPAPSVGQAPLSLVPPSTPEPQYRRWPLPPISTELHAPLMHET